MCCVLSQRVVMTQRSRLSKANSSFQAAVSLCQLHLKHTIKHLIIHVKDTQKPPATFSSKLWEADFYFRVFQEGLGFHSGSGSFFGSGCEVFLIFPHTPEAMKPTQTISTLIWDWFLWGISLMDKFFLALFSYRNSLAPSRFRRSTMTSCLLSLAPHRSREAWRG